jgi:hypothetical protein
MQSDSIVIAFDIAEDFRAGTLQKMLEIQMLEFDNDETRYRWNKAFKQ